MWTLIWTDESGYNQVETFRFQLGLISRVRILLSEGVDKDDILVFPNNAALDIDELLKEVVS